MAKKNVLKTYRERRNLKRSGEPRGGAEEKHAKPIFVIQEHAASHLHYDFRIEHDGVLLSWAVPKGPSLDPRIKRLAIPTDDHPLDYAKFEGEIPDGEYGAGQVIVWDTGTFENIKEKDGALVPMSECVKRGTIEIFLRGKKLHGAFALIRTRSNQWLLIKMRDENADARRNIVVSEPESVLSGYTIKELQAQHKASTKTTKAKRSKKNKKKTSTADDPTIKVGGRNVEITHPDKVIFPKPLILKDEFIEYYRKIAPYMIPYTKNRPLSMQRFTLGINHEGFYQKDAGDYFPAWIKIVPIKKQEDGVVRQVLVNDAATLVYLANQLCIVFHIWLSKVNSLHTPDHIIFDLDPSGKDFNQIRYAALKLKKVLEELGLVPFVMTTGSRGLHVVIPIKPEYDFDTVRSFAHDIAQFLVSENPELLTLEVRKAKRKGKIFVDTLRNAFAQTGVAPYSVRARLGAPVATPLEWKEVTQRSLRPDKYTIRNIFKRLARKGDLWKDINRSAKSITSARKKLDAIIKEKELE